MLESQTVFQNSSTTELDEENFWETCTEATGGLFQVNG